MVFFGAGTANTGVPGQVQTNREIFGVNPNFTPSSQFTGFDLQGIAPDANTPAGQAATIGPGSTASGIQTNREIFEVSPAGTGVLPAPTVLSGSPEERLNAFGGRTLDLAEQISTTPFAPLPSGVAPLSPEQRAALARANVFAGSAVPDFGGDVSLDIARGFTPDQVTAATIGGVGDITAERLANANLDPFLNPFTQGVIDTTNQEFNRQGDIQRNAIRNRAARAGAFGGSRGALQESELGRNLLDVIGRSTAGLNLENFINAQSGARFDIGNQLTASTSNQANQRALAIRQAELAQAAAVANQGAGLDAARVRLSGADQGLRAGVAADSAALARINAQLGVGGLARGVTGAQLGETRADVLREQNFPRDILSTRLGVTGQEQLAPQAAELERNRFGEVIGGVTGGIGIATALGQNPTLGAILGGAGAAIFG